LLVAITRCAQWVAHSIINSLMLRRKLSGLAGSMDLVIHDLHQTSELVSEVLFEAPSSEISENDISRPAMTNSKTAARSGPAVRYVAGRRARTGTHDAPALPQCRRRIRHSTPGAHRERDAGRGRRRRPWLLPPDAARDREDRQSRYPSNRRRLN
jgi:hypothetical protein